MKEIPGTKAAPIAAGKSLYLPFALLFALLFMPFQRSDAALVDSTRYIVGPGDEFSIEFFETQTEQITAEVSPEGIAAIPSVGAFALGGETLQRAKEILRTGLKNRFSGVTATISLAKVRRQRVLVSGAVTNPGLYDAPATNLVSDAIALAGGLTANASRRNIVIRGIDGETPADMDMFKRAGVLEANPPLYLGEIVHVPVMSDSSSRIYVSGAVRSPGWIEYTGRDKIIDLVALSGGFTADALRDSILIITRDEKSTVQRYRNLDFTEKLSGGASVVALQTLSELDQTVLVAGEVMAPGRYPMTIGLTLNGALRKAGGLTSSADSMGVMVFNSSIAGPALGSMSPVLSGSLDPARLLVPGDSIFVPERIGYVGVYGQVSRPGMLRYQSGWNAGQYLSAAGGGASLADFRTSVLIRRSSAVRIPYRPGVDVYDGDVIQIASRPVKEHKSALTTLRDIALIGAGFALTVYSIDQMGN